MDCIFCKIIAGEIPSAKVYEDEHVFGFLDIKPFTKGHCLVIPKQHFENVFDISEDALQKVMAAGKKIAENLKNTLQASALNIMQSSGREGGQEVMHFHLHVIPRYPNDGVNFHQAQHQDPTFEELTELAEKLI